MTSTTVAPLVHRSTLGARVVPIVLVCAAAVLLFGFGADVPGYATLAGGVGLAFAVERSLGRDLLLVAGGLTVISLVPLDADLSTQHMALMGGALAVAAVGPWAVSRFVYREHVVRFPVRTGTPWSTPARLYLVGVVVLGYLVLPGYLIRTGVYTNWPEPSDANVAVRLFLGINTVGIWDELFFVCTVFALLRRHVPLALANVLQAVIFASFLWEIGYRSWGPLLTFPFAMLQGYTFMLTKSLTYVVTVHLLFDAVLFLALVHAHDRQWLPVFLY